ncbi:MAG: AAA family ATPase, partial [Chlamydiia bacterium]|nr:AAA family ATPase [Chlamydiia bacterium]
MKKKLPTGIQSIKKILADQEYVYVDKTAIIKEIIDLGAPHYFVSRPRRFGKSLFLDTLKEIFLGN